MRKNNLSVLPLIIASAILSMPYVSLAADSNYPETELSIFQRLSDLMTGKYEVEKGKTVKEVNVVQAVANEINKMESPPVK